MNPVFWPSVVEIAAWSVALAWCARTTDALRNLPSVPNLIGLEWDVSPESLPALTVIVAARDEAADIAATLDTLMRQDYENLHAIAVDDRSSDGTGAIMDGFAERFPDRLTVVHVTTLPDGWLGKVHAMAIALAMCETEYVLFTDGDVLFSPSILRRALAYVERERADHFVVIPTMQVKSWGEGVLLGFFQLLSLWVTRPWRASDPKATRDVVGIGAFNLFRRDALERLGGLEPQRLVVLEDITLARRAKVAGMRQRLAFAPGLVLVHWATGVSGMMRVMSKNLFSAFNFRPVLALAACLGIVLFCLAPLAGIFWWGTIVPGLLVVACVLVGYRMYGEVSWIEAKFGWGFPLGAAMFMYAVVRSVVVVWKDGGVRWRGTLYPLRELRRWNSPRMWHRKRRSRKQVPPG